MNIKITKEQFIEEANLVHNNSYDYSLIEYKNNKTKIEIICLEHGIFKLTPYHHINRKQGCRLCGNKKISERFNKTTEDFIERSKNIHGDKYDYSLVDYIKNDINVKIICKDHGIFEQIPTNHLRGKGCFDCSYVIRTNHYRELNPVLFIEKAKKVHGNKYDYSQMKYNTCKEHITIICKKHGNFQQTPDSHVNGTGCPSCSETKGERKIRLFLQENNINFEYQKRFENCKNKNILPFDFYLPELNICIEYDGIQHYECIDWFGGCESLKTLQKRDNIKTKYCLDNGIELIRINYKDNIVEKLNSYILKEV